MTPILILAARSDRVAIQAGCRYRWWRTDREESVSGHGWSTDGPMMGASWEACPAASVPGDVRRAAGHAIAGIFRAQDARLGGHQARA